MTATALRFAFALAAAAAAVGSLGAQGSGQPGKNPVSFGVLRPAGPDELKKEAHAWLKKTGKAEAAQGRFEKIWSQNDRPVLDRLADTFALGDQGAAQLLAEARDFNKPAPTKVPPLLTDNRESVFFRANLALAYAKALSNRRIYEEALAALKTVRPEQVVDPAAYLFHRAVAEHSLSLRQDASRSINRLIDDAVDVPERYKMVSLLMAFDMQAWREKDLGWIARKMDAIERRLELARGGPHTQKIQKEVVARLDELIKQMENQAKEDMANGGA